jgi:glycosyltransferase involved in cell wall biosynthesis
LLVNAAPEVSIAIRAFRRRWLSEAIDSVLAQTYRDLELIIYDEAGALADVAARYDTDRRVRYHHGERHGGPGGRFRAALSLCRGEYVGLLDDDDRYEPQFVARLLAALKAEPTAGIAFCRTAWRLDDGRMVPSDPLPTGRLADAAGKLLACRLAIASSRMLIRRVAIEAAGRRQAMPDEVAPDLWTNVNVAASGWAHLAVGEQLVVQRWHADQLSRRDEGDIAVATFKSLVVYDPRLERIRRATLARQLVRRAIFRLRAGRREAARADLREARNVDAFAMSQLRWMFGAAARIPVAGPIAARTLLALPWLRRPRALPPSGARR